MTDPEIEHRLKTARMQRVVLFLVTVVGMGALGLSLQHSIDANEETRVAVLNETCRRDRVIQAQYNTLLDALVEVDEEIALGRDNLPTTVLEARIAAYQAGKIAPTICEEIKP